MFINITSIITGILTILGIGNAIRNRKTSGRLLFLCTTAAVFTFTGAFILSVLIRPILFPRYFTKVIGLYILIWMYGILLLKRDVFKIIAVVGVLGIFIPQIKITQAYNLAKKPQEK
jgi:hypothetical protein